MQKLEKANACCKKRKKQVSFEKGSTHAR